MMASPSWTRTPVSVHSTPVTGVFVNVWGPGEVVHELVEAVGDALVVAGRALLGPCRVGADFVDGARVFTLGRTDQDLLDGRAKPFVANDVAQGAVSGRRFEETSGVRVDIGEQGKVVVGGDLPHAPAAAFDEPVRGWAVGWA